MDNNTVIQTVIICVFLFFSWLLWVNHLNELNFIRAGYSPEILPGSGTTQWIKK